MMRHLINPVVRLGRRAPLVPARAMSLWGESAALERLFENNQKWREGKKLLDPDYFDKTSKGQHPQYLWIGCADSRVPAEEITGLAPGEMFVHRNIANMVVSNDMSALSVIQYAVEHLKVKDIIVCGHYGCGGVRAAMANQALGLLDNWLRNIRDVSRLHHAELTAIPDSEERLNRMIELNTVEQCMNIFKIGLVQRHQAKYGFPRIHGLVYDLKSGQLKELDVDFKSYVKQYSSIFKLHSFDSPDPDSYRREVLQHKMVHSLAKDHLEEGGRVSVTYLRKAMLQEPLLFSETEVDRAISYAQQSAQDKKSVEVSKVAAYFDASGAMVKRKKHDKDKYYNLARQQGYRARSAFKLIQLNKKYDFLSTAKVCIDLCAAPGGWCQVAAKYMPASSIIIGIDLLPIRPIRGVKTFQCDITTAKCQQIIKQETQSWQVDVVLCDGAPNVGAEYTKDAYVQNELALVALKLAVDVMGRGATFVSKGESAKTKKAVKRSKIAKRAIAGEALTQDMRAGDHMVTRSSGVEGLQEQASRRLPVYALERRIVAEVLGTDRRPAVARALFMRGGLTLALRLELELELGLLDFFFFCRWATLAARCVMYRVDVS
ncbi:hypothetical protein ATCC90586_008244 [Pythium insidiosum]|nr:hypothetical protein ATCC90586_008244 [Pythium insidiosum]